MKNTAFEGVDQTVGKDLQMLHGPAVPDSQAGEKAKTPETLRYCSVNDYSSAGDHWRPPTQTVYV